MLFLKNKKNKNQTKKTAETERVYLPASPIPQTQTLTLIPRKKAEFRYWATIKTTSSASDNICERQFDADHFPIQVTFLKMPRSYAKNQLKDRLREKCPNTELFLVRIFPHLD